MVTRKNIVILLPKNTRVRKESLNYNRVIFSLLIEPTSDPSITVLPLAALPRKRNNSPKEYSHYE